MLQWDIKYDEMKIPLDYTRKEKSYLSDGEPLILLFENLTNLTGSDYMESKVLMYSWKQTTDHRYFVNFLFQHFFNKLIHFIFRMISHYY